jgi:hypothetical protein
MVLFPENYEKNIIFIQKLLILVIKIFKKPQKIHLHQFGWSDGSSFVKWQVVRLSERMTGAAEG